jgi:flagellar motility protein MotE (MotC chaperone)
MNLSLKKIAVIAFFALSSFPVVILCVLLLTGNARIEFGPHPLFPAGLKVVDRIKQGHSTDSLGALASKTFQAVEQEKNEIAIEKQQLAEKQQALELFEHDLEARKAELAQERSAIAALSATGDSLAGKKMRRLSKVYGAMKPAEAAQIIGSLGDATAAAILDGIGDDRQKAKIFAALPPEKAAGLTLLMGGQRRAALDSSAVR